MKATVSAGVTRTLDPTDFCSGIKKDGSSDGWYSVWKCGRPAEQPTGATPRYCASSGQLTAGDAWAAGFSTATTDGRELLDGRSDTTKDLHHSAATFYSRTPVWMGALRLPAGMYELMPAQSPDGWKLAVAKQHGEYLGSVEMKTAASDDPAGKNLVISTNHRSEGCTGPSPDFNVRELHFSYGSTNLFVCLRPDQVPVSQEVNVSQR
ncbi:MAG TPA: hypothetical protein VGG59_08130 [Acidobacteriaceae bacterium]|jgi:hypothetical protein